MRKNILLTYLLWSGICLLAMGRLFAQGVEGQIPAIEIHKARFALREIDRPGIMPTGIINMETSASMTGLKTIDWNVGAQFGIAKKLHGEINYDGLQFNQFEAKRIVNAALRYNYFASSFFGADAHVKLPIHIRDGEIIREITFSLPVAFFNNTMAAGFLKDLFTLTMRKNVAMSLKFPFWYGIQLGDVWASIDSSLGELNMKNDNNQAKWENKGFWQQLPINLSAKYPINHRVDIGANFGFNDTFKPKDSINFGLSFAVRGGQLFG